MGRFSWRTRFTQVMAGMLHRHGNPLAFVGATRFYLCPEIERLHRRDRDRRAVEAVCVALLQGRNPGPFVLVGPPRQ